MSIDHKVMSDQEFYAFSHPFQKSRFYMALVFAIILFPVVAIGLIAGTVFLVVPMVAFLIWVGARLLFASLLGNSVLVSKLNYPRINALTEELQEKMDYKKPIFIFVYENGNFNAYMRHIFFRRAIFLNSEVLETGVSDNEARWLIGRFIGYLRARRQAGMLGWVIRAAQHLLVFNLFLLPYERAMVYTGDRLAVAAIDGDISSAISAMQKLLVGRQLGYSLNPEGIIDQQRQLKGSIFAFLACLVSSFPNTTARYVDLIVFAKACFPVQFAKFEASNPGIPADLPQLAASARAQSSSAPPSAWAWATVTSLIVVGIGFVVLSHIAPGMITAIHRAPRDATADASPEEAATSAPATTSEAAPPAGTQTNSGDATGQLIIGILRAAEQGDWTNVDRRVQTMKPTALVDHGDRKTARVANTEGLRALAAKDYVTAISAFTRGVRVDTSDVEIRNNLAFAYLESGDVSSAVDNLVDVLQAAPDRSIAWANMAEAFVQLKKPDMADASLKVAVRFNADRTQSVSYLNNITETHPNEQFRESAARVLKDIDSIPLIAQ